MSDIIEASVIDGVVQETNFVDCEITARECYIIVTSLQYLCKEATQETVDELIPVIMKLKKLAGIKDKV